MNTEGRDSGKHALETASVAMEPLDRMHGYWAEGDGFLEWTCPFVLPAWLNVWSGVYGRNLDVRIYVVRRNGKLIGLAPLVIDGQTARLVGDEELIDYSDFIVARGEETHFFRILFDFLRREGVARLDTGRVSEGSSIIHGLQVRPEQETGVHFKESDVMYDIRLPQTWEQYFDILSGKERHELRRKFRRLDEAGDISYSIAEKPEDVEMAMEDFLRLFMLNRPDKSRFMNEKRVSFFRRMAEAMSSEGLLKLFVLDINGTPAASAMCFDYRSTVYLYNMGYDRRFSSLAAGLLCIACSIRYSIEQGRKTYNLLRGDEAYKRRLGGAPVPLMEGCIPVGPPEEGEKG